MYITTLSKFGQKPYWLSEWQDKAKIGLGSDTNDYNDDGLRVSDIDFEKYQVALIIGWQGANMFFSSNISLIMMPATSLLL